MRLTSGVKYPLSNSSHEKARKADELTTGETRKVSKSSHGKAASSISFGLPRRNQRRSSARTALR